MKTTNDKALRSLEEMARIKKTHKAYLLKNPGIVKDSIQRASLEHKLMLRRIGKPGMAHVKDKYNDN